MTAFARDMLAVADNLARALESLPAKRARERRRGAQGPDRGRRTDRARPRSAALGRHGVKKLEPQGEKFDPNLHQAMFEVPDESVPSGTVTQVVQSGWTIGDRVLRPAMVGVSKGGPKAVKTAE